MTVAPAQASWNVRMASSMAFFWADDPSPFRVPLAQAVFALLEPELLAPGAAVSVVLLSEPQADRASEPTRATPERPAMRRLVRVFTVSNLSYSTGE